MPRKDLKRPELGACTNSDIVMLKLLDGVSSGQVTYTKDQMKNLERVYGPLDREEMRARLQPDFIGPLKQRHESAFELLEAGAVRNIFRAVETDGLRCIGVLAKFLEKEEDPVKLLIRLLNDAGYDVGDSIEWATDEDEEN